MTRRKLRRERRAFNRMRRAFGTSPERRRDWAYVYPESWAGWLAMHEGGPVRTWFAPLSGPALRRWERAVEASRDNWPF